MERKPRQNSKSNKKIICSVIIALLYILILVGLLNTSTAPITLVLLPLHFLILLGCLIYSHRDKNKDFKIFILVALLAGFLVAVLGVNTGYIFGPFQYGDTLGPKLAEVPLVIGVFWTILIYSIGTAVSYLKIQNHAIRALVGAFFLVFMDILLEPVAMRFDYWNWENMSVPFQNYVAWFVFSFVMLLFFYARKFRKQSMAALVLVISQFVFFMTLNMFS